MGEVAFYIEKASDSPCCMQCIFMYVTYQLKKKSAYFTNQYICNMK